MKAPTKRECGGRRPTGTVVKTRDGSWQPMVTLADGTRKRVSKMLTLPDGRTTRVPLKFANKAEAKRKAEFYAAQAQQMTRQPPTESDRTAVAGCAEEVELWWKLFFEEKRERGDSDWKGDQGRFETHIRHELNKPMAEVTRDDCEAVRDALDQKIRSGTLGWKTAWNAWSVLTTACDAAASSKVRALRVRHDNPCSCVKPPDRRPPKAKAWLWPSEFLALVRCETVPLKWRRIYTLATYLYLRAGELRALDWRDVDLVQGIALSHRSMTRDQRSTKATKTGVVRRYAIERSLLPLLRAMRDECASDGRLVELGDRKHWAKNLRAHLQLAGVDRADLFANDETRKHITFHDLKATAGTWMALRGDNPLAIMQRLAHRDLKTTLIYVRSAEMVGETVGEPFPNLPVSLLGIRETHANIARTGSSARDLVEPPGIELALAHSSSTATSLVSRARPMRSRRFHQRAKCSAVPTCLLESTCLLETFWRRSERELERDAATLARWGHAPPAPDNESVGSQPPLRCR